MQDSLAVVHLLVDSLVHRRLLAAEQLVLGVYSPCLADKLEGNSVLLRSLVLRNCCLGAQESRPVKYAPNECCFIRYERVTIQLAVSHANLDKNSVNKWYLWVFSKNWVILSQLIRHLLLLYFVLHFSANIYRLWKWRIAWSTGIETWSCWLSVGIHFYGFLLNKSAKTSGN